MLQEIQFIYNNISGTLPSDLCHGVPMLEKLDLSGNAFSGQIPSSLHQCKKLKYLKMISNRFYGQLPSEIGRLSMLQELDLSNNNLSGSLPPSLFNISSLRLINLRNNMFSGQLPEEMCQQAHSLQQISILNNRVGGTVPRSISNCTSLKRLFLGVNFFTGTIPNEIGDYLKNLEQLHLQANNLSGEIPSSLFNASMLLELVLANNTFTRVIPDSIGNLRNLQLLYLIGNKLTSDPSSPEISFLSSLTKCRQLEKILISMNPLNGTLPNSIGTCQTLFKHLMFGVVMSSFGGSLPNEISGMNAVIKLDISKNHLSGELPNEIGSLQKIMNLSLANNMLQGPIPDSVGNMLSLEFLDLSHNLLSGIIPKSIEKLFYLKFINLSYNKLQGEIPSGGNFANFTAQSFMMNDALCGRPELGVQPCPINGTKQRKTGKKLLLKLIIPLIIVSCIFVGCAILLIYKRKYNKASSIDDINLPTLQFPSRISYHELVEATKNFDEHNLLGKGSFGSVYKGELSSNAMVIAVKVFNLEVQEGSRSFDMECEAMRNLRHRNLVKVITSCSNVVDFKAIVMEFVPNGSLEKWLYSHNYFLSFVQRLNIAIDIASALEYLHHGNSKPVVHCDLKPSNVLLDENMVAHVCDFGISKLLEEKQSQIHTNTLATLGYIAPEYGSKGVVSIKGDVYSYGIILMEVFTRKKPTDEMFVEGLSLRSWIQDSMPHEIIQVLDHNLLEGEEQLISAMEAALSNIIVLALNCSANTPDERMSMEEVLSRLNKIKTVFLQMVEGNLS
ncbi:Serine/threonine-protein kinase, active site [Sesbania bispinosa]|nr:Serine/threonine-protein kinase, active site [Sesbania bispinosa]